MSKNFFIQINLEWQDKKNEWLAA